MSASLDEARAALRQRQGGGARYDAANAPARELDWARRGTAYFTRLLNGLPDVELDATSDWNHVSRRHLVVLAAYHARMLAELVAWARENRAGPLPRPARVEKAELAWGMTLPDHALRNLVQHAIVHLDVEWRDLDDAGWDRNVTDSEGRSVTVRETPQWRARLIWTISTRLRAGGRRADVPAGLGEALREIGRRSCSRFHRPVAAMARLACLTSGRWAVEIYENECRWPQRGGQRSGRRA